MTTATFRISTPLAAPAKAARATNTAGTANQKGFWARALDALIRARQAQVEQQLRRYGAFSKDGHFRLPPYL